MEIEITLPGGAVVGWDGRHWSVVSGSESDPASEAVAVMNRHYRPGLDEGIGDHHLPPGVGVATRAASMCGGKVTAAPKWSDELPEGAIA